MRHPERGKKVGLMVRFIHNEELENTMTKENEQKIHNQLTHQRRRVPMQSGDWSGISNRHDEVGGKGDGICGDISAIRGDITKICGYVSAIRGDASRICGDVTKIEGDVSNIRGNVSRLEGDVSALEGDVTGIEGCVEDIIAVLNSSTNTHRLHKTQLGV